MNHWLVFGHYAHTGWVKKKVCVFFYFPHINTNKCFGYTSISIKHTSLKTHHYTSSSSKYWPWLKYACGLFFQYLVPCLTVCPFLTPGAHVVSVGYLLQGYVLDVERLGRVVLLLGVNHAWELGVRAQCHPSTLPLETNNTRFGLAQMSWATWNRGISVRQLIPFCMLGFYLLRASVQEQFSTRHRCETNMWNKIKK